MLDFGIKRSNKFSEEGPKKAVRKRSFTRIIIFVFFLLVAIYLIFWDLFNKGYHLIKDNHDIEIDTQNCVF
jgi:hypothetical protein